MTNIFTNRRSIRKFRSDKVSHYLLEKIVCAGMAAPSAKNRQPWHFVVTTGKSKETALSAMERGLNRERTDPLLPASHVHLADAEHTLSVMRQSYAVIFTVNRLAEDIGLPLSTDERVFDICNAQSIGAAMENMSLAAADLGLGSLWICNTFFAQIELREWLNIPGEPYAALAVGFPDEYPSPRPREPLDKLVEWRT